MKKIAVIMALLVSVIAAPAFALDLQEARLQGLVGETKAGYVARIGGGGEVAKLVSEVNLKRRAEYERISAENGQPVDVVGRLAYGQIVVALPTGAKYQDAKGRWVGR